MSTTIHKGIVRWYKPALQFGFIAIAPSLKQELGLKPDQDLFVHAGGLATPHPKALAPEDRVEFEIQQGSKGPRAIRCRVVSHAPATQLAHVAD